MPMDASATGNQVNSRNPLLSNSPRIWDELIQAVGPASLLVAIDARLGRLLKRSLTAEDILQEALFHAWNSRASCEWRGLKAFRSWLLSIIDNRIRDAADRQGAQKRGGNVQTYSLDGPPNSDGRPSASASYRMPTALIDSTTPSRLAMYREQAAAMQAALEELPEELREVVRLRLVEQMPLETIAHALGLGVAAVRHRFRKGAELYHHRLKLSQSSLRSAAMLHARNSAPLGDGFPASGG